MNIYEVTIDRRVKPKDEPEKDWVTTFQIACRSLLDARKKASLRVRTSYPQYYIIDVKRHW